MSDFVEVVDTRTDLKQRVPAHWIGDPVLGRFIEKTPSQRALDGDLGPAPTEESTVKEIKAFAEKAGIDTTGLKKHDELLEAVRAVVGTDPLPEPHADQDVDVEQPSGLTEGQPPAGGQATDSAAASAAGGTTETPAAGAKE
ncbi:hypothetical protein GON03_19030 [Nocardioides sp. MAH-18]|uniref:Uncharacterized protein n=1 Tax=Nocardioides agri TaxID=2682843 RepID=A0A6L6XVP3_9ACTN|nr:MULTISPECIES: hypothetical protein [unclassified Nocardioides]MBA2952111.1 hypothetical protein [Nocardioides sp. CGMCC 1.13656]MVQ51280.1 hypothetical protein [Nocardioides sp. MAH-18]